MPTNILDQNVLKGRLTAAWQAYLRTPKDPASGLWYTADPDTPSQQGGLYGDVFDNFGLQPDQRFKFYTDAMSITSSDVYGTSHIFDNIHGFAPTGVAHVSLGVSDSQSYMNPPLPAMSTSNKRAERVSQVLTVSPTSSFMLNFDYDWSESQKTTYGIDYTRVQDVAVTIPKGKKYQVEAVGKLTALQIMYDVFLHVGGISSAWFDSPVTNPFTGESSKHHTSGVGPLFDVTGSADNGQYAAYPYTDGTGAFKTTGWLTIHQYSGVGSRVLDVTSATSEQLQDRAYLESLQPKAV